MISIKKVSTVAQLILFVFIFAFSISAAGEVDLTFSGSAYGELANQGQVYVVKTQPDGKILIGGRFTEVQGFAASGLARLNADGTVDRTFKAPDLTSYNPNNGTSFFGGEIYAIAVQSDGKIVVGGNIFIGIFGQIGARNGIKRLNADGSNDSSFFIELMTPGSEVSDIKLQPDGKILLGGGFALGPSNSTRNLARLNSDGTNDTTFSADTSNTQIKELDIQSDGKIIAGGYSGTISTPSARVYRFYTDGTKDLSFASIESGNGTLEALKIQADGKIVFAGNFTTFGGVNKGRISRLNSDGTLDENFNLNGVGANATVNDIAIRADGKLTIGGNFSSFNGVAIQRIARLNADGALDITFSNSGTVTDTAVNDLELLPDNRILAGLNTSTLVNPLLRFSADGAFDSSYVIRANRGGIARRVLQQSDGKILIGGEFRYANGTERRSLVRFNADGTLDSAFVPYFSNQSPLPIINALALQPDGKILVGTSNGIVLQRLNTDGSQDTTFNASMPSSSNVFDILVQADGKILVGGLMTYVQPTFARFNSDGTRDTSFNPAQPNSYVTKILIQPDGKIVVGGVFSQIGDIAFRKGVARYNVDGVLDSSFIPPNTTTSPIDMDIQSDGKIVIVGNGVRRLNTDGTFDGSLEQPANSFVSAIKIQSDGKILVGGDFSNIGNTARNGIARFNPNGTIDNSFTTFANRGVQDLQFQDDGKILVVGAFSKINGISNGRIARLLNVSVPQSTLFDYDGDGKADVSVFRPSTNRWYELLSSNSTVTEQTFGVSGDVVAPADFDGDGKTDIAIFRPTSGDWWYLSSINNAQVQIHWGQAGDIPRPSDFDGDGKADFVLFRPSENNWYRLGSTGAVSIPNFGSANDKPVTGDFDGDGKSDAAIYRPIDRNVVVSIIDQQRADRDTVWNIDGHPGGGGL